MASGNVCLEFACLSLSYVQKYGLEAKSIRPKQFQPKKLVTTMQILSFLHTLSLSAGKENVLRNIDTSPLMIVSSILMTSIIFTSSTELKYKVHSFPSRNVR